jgi:hypothetical protein
MEILLPKNIALRNNLFVPYQVPLKFGLSANSIALPNPILETISEAEPGIKSFLFNSEIYQSM